MKKKDYWPEKPPEEDFAKARDVIEAYVKYLRIVEPFAVNSIHALERALEEL